MKIRKGFVSNSSSSSFVLFGKKIRSLEDFNDADCAGKDIFFVGEYLCDGNDFIQVESWNREFFRNGMWENNDGYVLFAVDKKVELESGDVDVNPHVGEDVMFVCADYHGTDSIDKFFERYVNNHDR